MKLLKLLFSIPVLVGTSLVSGQSPDRIFPGADEKPLPGLSIFPGSITPTKGQLPHKQLQTLTSSNG